MLSIILLTYIGIRWNYVADDIETTAKYISSAIRKAQPFVATLWSICADKFIKDCQTRGLVAKPQTPPRPPRVQLRPKFQDPPMPTPVPESPAPEPEPTAPPPGPTPHTHTYANIFDAPLNY